MDSFEDSSWDLLNYSFIDDDKSTHLYWVNPSGSTETDLLPTGVLSQEKECAEKERALKSASAETYLLPTGVLSQEKECMEKERVRKRGRNDSCSRPGSKACREKLRRERLNDRFSDLSSVLEPGRPVTTDKPAILGDAIRVVKQLRTEAQELEEANEKLLEEIKSLKAEKNELREEKLVLKADKERMEQQLKHMTVSPAGFMPAHPAPYHAGANKMPVFSSYGLIPMWQCLPPSALDTSHDHELRPPAA